VHADGVFVNAVLVEEGFARVVYIVPNTELYPRLKAAQSAARAAGRGLWGACY
jgi:micrococcal nuclease